MSLLPIAAIRQAVGTMPQKNTVGGGGLMPALPKSMFQNLPAGGGLWGQVAQNAPQQPGGGNFWSQIVRASPQLRNHLTQQFSNPMLQPQMQNAMWPQDGFAHQMMPQSPMQRLAWLHQPDTLLPPPFARSTRYASPFERLSALHPLNGWSSGRW